MDFITSDRTLKVGDLVFSNYHKGEFIFKITDIERRYLTQHDLRYSYANGSIGDEYNPLAFIKLVANLSIFTDVNKKIKNVSKSLDMVYLKRVDPNKVQEHINRLNALIIELWP